MAAWLFSAIAHVCGQDAPKLLRGLRIPMPCSPPAYLNLQFGKGKWEAPRVDKNRQEGAGSCFVWT